MCYSFSNFPISLYMKIQKLFKIIWNILFVCLFWSWLPEGIPVIQYWPTSFLHVPHGGLRRNALREKLSVPIPRTKKGCWLHASVTSLPLRVALKFSSISIFSSPAHYIEFKHFVFVLETAPVLTFSYLYAILCLNLNFWTAWMQFHKNNMIDWEMSPFMYPVAVFGQL